jgi:hypothetical protein
MSNSLQVALEVVDKSTKSLDAIGRSFNGIQGKIEKFANVASKIFIGGAVVKQMQEMTSAALSLGENINDAANRMGTTATVAQEIGYVAKMSGSSLEAMERGFRTLSVSAYDAYTGSAKAKKGFETLGVSVKGSNGELKDSGELFRDSVLKLSQIENTTERAAIAQQLFGKASKEVLGIAAQGSDGIKRLYDETKNFGMLLSDETVAKLDQAKDAQDRLNQMGVILSANITTVWVPALTFATMAITGNAKAFWDLEQSMIATSAATKIDKKELESLNKEEAVLSDRIKEAEGAGRTTVSWRDKSNALRTTELRVAKAELDIIREQAGILKKNSAGKSAPTIAGEGSDKSDDKDAKRLASLKKKSAEQQAEEADKENLEWWKTYTKRKTEQAEQDFQFELAENEKDIQRRNEHIKRVDQLEAEAAAERKRKKEEETEQQIKIYEQFGEGVGYAVASNIGKGEEGAKQAYKSVLETSVQFLENQILLAMGSVAAFNIMQFGIPAGPIITGLESGMIMGLGAAAKAGIQSFESGGYPRAGAALVGERGPEIVQMSGNERVFNNRDSRAMMQNQTQAHFHFYDKKGSEVSTMSAQIRSGQADSLVSDIMNSAKRRGLV